MTHARLGVRLDEAAFMYSHPKLFNRVDRELQSIDTYVPSRYLDTLGVRHITMKDGNATWGHRGAAMIPSAAELQLAGARMWGSAKSLAG